MYYKELFYRLKRALKDYFKGLLLLFTLNFLILSIGLKLIGIDLWGLKAFFITLVDVLPVLGSGIVMIPWAIFRALSGSLAIGSYLAILYVLLVIIRFLAEPVIVGKKVGLSPLLTLAISAISIIIFGPLGAIISGVITIVFKVFWEVASGKSAISEDKDPWISK